ncbi:alpha/beta hydrolase, partial [Enterococcus faecalis]
GKSSGNKIGMGWLDRLDLFSWLSEVLAIDMEAEIILVGGSIGAATVMMASGVKLPTNVRGLIVDCGYTSVYVEIKNVLHESFHLPAFPILTI